MARRPADPGHRPPRLGGRLRPRPGLLHRHRALVLGQQPQRAASPGHRPASAGPGTSCPAAVPSAGSGAAVTAGAHPTDRLTHRDPSDRRRPAASTGSYVVRTDPWSMLTTPRPATRPGEGARCPPRRPAPGHRGPGGQVDPAVTRSVARASAGRTPRNTAGAPVSGQPAGSRARSSRRPPQGGPRTEQQAARRPDATSHQYGGQRCPCREYLDRRANRPARSAICGQRSVRPSACGQPGIEGAPARLGRVHSPRADPPSDLTSHARLTGPSRTGRHQRSRPLVLQGASLCRVSIRRRRTARCRATVRRHPRVPARKEYGHGRRHHAPAARERRPLRTPDPPLEPEDEALHLHRAQRHLHHRPAAVADLHRPRVRVRQGDRRPRRHDPVRRHQEAGPGGHRRAGHPRRHAVREPALARRHADQLPHRHQAHPAPQGARGDRLRRRRRLRPDQEGTARSCAARRTSWRRPSAASAT